MKQFIKDSFPFLVMIILAIPVVGGLYYLFDEELSSWSQAVGTIFAVLTGLFVVRKQITNQQEIKRKERETLTRTTYLLAYDAFNLVCYRLNNALSKKKIKFLQEARTTEMICIMKDFQIIHIPVNMLRGYIQIRSQLVAINEGINNFFKKRENDEEDERDLDSSIRVLREAINSLEKLCEVAKTSGVGDEDILRGPEIRYEELQRKLSDLDVY